MITRDGNKEVEDLLSVDGVPTFCVQRSAYDPQERDVPALPVLEVVFPMNMESAAYDAVRTRWTQISRLFAPGLRVQFRTILFHLAREQFGTIQSAGQRLISVNIVNLQDPDVRRASLRSKKVNVLTYHVNLVAVGSPTSVARRYLGNEARAVANQFNHESRYLKIGALKLGFTPLRIVTGPVQLQPI